MKAQRADRRGAFFVEEGEVRDASAEDDDVGIEDVDDGRDGSPEVRDDFGEDGAGVGVLGAAGRDVGQGALRAGALGVGLFDRGAAQVALDAAATAAVAGQRGARIEDDVAPLARDSLEAGPGVASRSRVAEDDAAAHARAEDDPARHARASRRAVLGLGEREAVRVVRERDRVGAERAGEVAAERAAVEARRVRVLHEGLGRARPIGAPERHAAGHAHADAREGRESGLAGHVADDLRGGRDDVVVAALLLGGNAHAGDHAGLAALVARPAPARSTTASILVPPRSTPTDSASPDAGSAAIAAFTGLR